MEADEVDTAGEVAEDAQEFVGMADGVVLPMPADVFKTDTSLVRPVVLLEESDDLRKGVHLLGGHNLAALCGKGIMQGDGEMTVGLVEEALEVGVPDGGDGDTLGRPCTAPVSCEHLQRAEDIVEVVHGLAFAHIDDIGEVGEVEYLVENLGSRQVPVEAQSARHAEFTAHLTACLRRDAERGAVGVGDIDGLDVGPSLALPAEGGNMKEVLAGAVLGDGFRYGGMATCGIVLLESVSALQRDIGHLVKGHGTADIQPLGELLTRELRKTYALRYFLQLCQCLA